VWFLNAGGRNAEVIGVQPFFELSAEGRRQAAKNLGLGDAADHNDLLMIDQWEISRILKWRYCTI
jgi:hypothetical protein